MNHGCNEGSTFHDTSPDAVPYLVVDLLTHFYVLIPLKKNRILKDPLINCKKTNLTNYGQFDTVFMMELFLWRYTYSRSQNKLKGYIDSSEQECYNYKKLT